MIKSTAIFFGIIFSLFLSINGKAQCNTANIAVIEVPAQVSSIARAIDAAKNGQAYKGKKVIVKVAYGIFEATHVWENKEFDGLVLDRACLDLIGIPDAGKRKPVIQRSKFKANDESIIEIKSSDIKIEGFDIRTTKSNCAYGVRAQISRDERFSIDQDYALSNITILRNTIRDIGNDSCENSFGLIFWNDNLKEIRNVLIEGNVLTNLRLGSSETMTIKNNINGFVIKDNIITNVSNIGIDIIGFEENTNFQAQNGKIIHNTISGLTSGNGAYPWVAGIYIDGGKTIDVLDNRVSNFGIGISIASEKFKKNVDSIKVYDNYFYENLVVGISVGHGLDFGKDYFGDQRGYVRNVDIARNRIYDNGRSDDGGQLRVVSQLTDGLTNVNIEDNDFCIDSNQKFRRLIYWDNSLWNDDWQTMDKSCVDNLCPPGSSESQFKKCVRTCYRKYSKNYKIAAQINTPLTVKFINNRFNTSNYLRTWYFDRYNEFGDAADLEKNWNILKDYFYNFDKSNAFGRNACGPLKPTDN